MLDPNENENEEDPASGEPASSQGGQSPFTDPGATYEYWRLVNDGVDPGTAALIVRTALYGVPHDWQWAGGDTGTPWSEGVGGSSYGERVNQYRMWEPARDSACPPDSPYRWEGNSPGGDIRNGRPSDYGSSDTSTCVEKPTDVPPGYQQGGSGGGQQDQTQDDEVVKAAADSSNSLTDLQAALMDRFSKRDDIFKLLVKGEAAVPGETDFFGKGLAGGGLWWGVDESMFDKNNAGTPTSVTRPASPATVTPTSIEKGTSAVSSYSAPNEFVEGSLEGALWGKRSRTTRRPWEAKPSYKWGFQYG